MAIVRAWMAKSVPPSPYRRNRILYLGCWQRGERVPWAAIV